MEDFQKKFILAILGYAAERGLGSQRLCDLSGIDFKSLSRKTTSRVDADQLNCLWKNAAHLTADSLFGLHFGESMQLAAIGIVGQIVQTSSTVGEALSNACALTGLITDMFQMRIHHGKGTFRVMITPDKTKAEKYPSTYRHMSDFLMVFTLHELNGLVLERLQPNQARFPYTVTETFEYNRVLRCNVNRKADETWLEFPNRVLNIQVISASYELQNHLLNKVSILMKAGEPGGSFHKKVYNYLLSNSFLYSLTLEAVAANFNMSVRSLQRKLKEEGITFLEIVDAVRMALAITYLRSGNYPVKDIAFALGYNEQTAFVRAFKRWTGKTPVAYKTTLNEK
jgi:AraC-like DNA-binding protein